VSLLWGLGSDEVRRTVESVHDQAVSATLAWVEAEAMLTEIDKLVAVRAPRAGNRDRE